MSPQGDPIPNVEGGIKVPEMFNREIIEALIAIARAMIMQVNLCMVHRVNVVGSTMTSRLRNFVRINPPIFSVTKVGEDHQKFLDEVYKIVHAIGVTSWEKAESASYQLKDVSKI